MPSSHTPRERYAANPSLENGTGTHELARPRISQPLLLDAQDRGACYASLPLTVSRALPLCASRRRALLLGTIDVLSVTCRDVVVKAEYPGGFIKLSQEMMENKRQIEGVRGYVLGW